MLTSWRSTRTVSFAALRAMACVGMLLAARMNALPLPEGGGQMNGRQLTPLHLQAEAPHAVLGTTYSQVFTMSGGQAPYQLSMEGELPAGITWKSTDTGAVLSGTPTRQGSFTFRVQARDASGQVTSEVVTLEVSVRPKLAGPVNVPLTETVTTTDIVSVVLPAIVTLSETITTADSVQVLAPVSIGVNETLTVTDDVNAGPEADLILKTVALPDGTYKVAYSAALAAGGGSGSYAFSLPAGGFPQGLTLASNGTISGTPTFYGSFSFTARVTDSFGHSADKTLSINVSAGTTGSTTQTITVGSTSGVTYANLTFSLSSTASSGLPVIYNVISGPISGTNPFNVNGAGLAIVQVAQPGNSTYKAATPVNAFILIGGAPITVTPNAVSRAFEAANPALAAYTFQMSGFVRGDNASIVGGSVKSVSTTAVANSPAGIYPTTPEVSGLAAQNYTFVAGTGNLTVTGGAAQTIFFVRPPDISVNQMTHLAAFTTSGLPVSYSVSGPATLTGNYVRATGAGTITVTATQSGNATYNAATNVVRSFSAQ